MKRVVKNVLERFEDFRGGSERFREVPRGSEKCGKIGLHHDMWGRCAPSMAAKWSHLLLVL